MDDHGMTAQVGSSDPKRPNYFDMMESRYQLDVPPIKVHTAPSDIKKFINDLFSNAPPAIGDIYIGTHANSDGFLLVTCFSGALDANGNPTDVTDMEVLDQALAPSAPVKIPDSLIGYQSGAPTHSVHIKGCNIGRNRLRDTLKPINPFLVRFQKALGGHVKATAPKHFHGLGHIPGDNHDGILEYMAHEFIVRTKAVWKTGKKGGWQGYADRGALVTAYQKAKLSYYDGTKIPDADWDTLVPKNIPLTATRKVPQTTSLPLGRTVEGATSVPVDKQFRIELEEVDWTLPAGSFPTDIPGRLNKLRASIAADGRFAASHPWPMWERRGFTGFDDYWNGHDWAVGDGNVNRAGDLVCVGRRIDYTIVQPIVDRTVTPAANRPLIFNFYPGTGSTQQPILTGLVESDDKFFGRA